MILPSPVRIAVAANVLYQRLAEERHPFAHEGAARKPQRGDITQRLNRYDI